MRALSDQRLLEHIRNDNRLAFTELVNRYWEQLYKHLFYKIKQEDQAKDDVQEIFISLWDNRLKVVCDAQMSLSSYLFKAARYRAIDYFSRPHTAIPFEDVLETALQLPSDHSADSVVLLKELEEVIDKELAGLPERLQQPYRLSREQHLSIKEIAAQLSISEQTVKNNISIVLQKLKAKVTGYQSDPVICLIVILATMNR